MTTNAKVKFSNKTFLDPGRFRYAILFYEQVANINSQFGDQTPVETLVMSTRAIMERIETRPSSVYNQIFISAGETLRAGDLYYVIRARKDWEPKKDMVAIVSGVRYKIRGLIPQDQPINYWRLLVSNIDT